MSPLRRALFHNWRLKLSAVGLSVFLWALVQSPQRTEETLSSVPVHVELADTQWTVSGATNPSSVELRVRGPAREIIRVAREGTTLRVPVASVGSADSLITLRRDWVELDQRAGLVVESVSPSVIAVAFEPAVTRLVPIAMRVQGRVRDDLALATPIGVNPQLIRVRGPESRLLGLDSIPLQPFDLEQATTSGVYTVAVDTAGLSGASVVPPTATLGIRVEDLIERELDGLVVRVDVSPGEAPVVADPDTIRLTLSGARTVVTSLDASLLRVWVPAEFLQAMAPGEERRLRVQVGGVPQLVTAIPGTEFVTVRRAVDVAGGAGRQPRR